MPTLPLAVPPATPMRKGCRLLFSCSAWSPGFVSLSPAMLHLQRDAAVRRTGLSVLLPIWWCWCWWGWWWCDDDDGTGKRWWWKWWQRWLNNVKWKCGLFIHQHCSLLVNVTFSFILKHWSSSYFENRRISEIVFVWILFYKIIIIFKKGRL